MRILHERAIDLSSRSPYTRKSSPCAQAATPPTSEQIHIRTKILPIDLRNWMSCALFPVDYK